MWWQHPFTAIDTETTGLDWFNDRVIQIGMSYFQNGQCLGGYDQIINSGKSSCPEALDTHHITDEIQEIRGELPEIVFPLIQSAIQESVFIVIMNAPFDLNFIAVELKRLGRQLDIPNVIDPLVIDRFYSKNRIPSLARGQRTLKALSERYGIKDYPLHDAGHDSRRVGELAIEMGQRHGQLGRSPLNELMKKQRKWHQTWSDDFASFADAKGFLFKRTNWPCEGIQWQTNQLPLDMPLESRQVPRTRRALPSSTSGK